MILSKRDVLIIGGGPVGSRVAEKLARSGLDVMVLEKKPVTGGKICCTGLISRECFDRFTLGRDAILRQFNKAVILPPSAHAISVERPSVQAYAIDRGVLDLKMSQQAIASGAEYSLGHNVLGLEVQSDRVVAWGKNGGRRFEHEARAVVLAAGYGSGALYPGGKAGDRAIGVQAEVEMSGDDLEIYLGRHFAPGFFAWLVPLDGTRGFAGLMARRNARKYFEGFVSCLYSHGKIRDCETRPLLRGITLKPPRRTFGERLLVVGDAAGQVKPITGGGIYFGLLCADIAADCLRDALGEDDLSPRRLSDYQRCWHDLLGRELKIAYYARKIFEGMSDAFIRRLLSMNKAGNTLQALAGNQSIGFDWHGRAITRAARQFLLNY